jgi:hypothetical protein
MHQKCQVLDFTGTKVQILPEKAAACDTYYFKLGFYSLNEGHCIRNLRCSTLLVQKYKYCLNASGISGSLPCFTGTKVQIMPEIAGFSGYNVFVRLFRLIRSQRDSSLRTHRLVA